MGRVKQLALRALTGGGLAPLYRPFMRGRATVLMLHRFRDPQLGNSGHDPVALRRCLAGLRAQGYRLAELPALLQGIALGEPGWDRAIAFTIDDGYRDQVAIGLPVFAEFDCPVTTFVTTGFLDGQLWFWWDQIDYVFRTTRRAAVEVGHGPGQLRYERDVHGYGRAQADFTIYCTRVPEAAKHAAIKELAASAEVELPTTPPAAYQPMTWDELRGAEGRGMRFGPHSVTHPVLARTTEQQSRFEIIESWRRLQQETQRAIPIFCYPNGQAGDFTARETGVIRDAGLTAAVSAIPGYADHAVLQADRDAAFAVPRFSYSEDGPTLRQYVSGLEALKDALRPRRPDR